jgi:hypothetical protein
MRLRSVMVWLVLGLAGGSLARGGPPPCRVVFDTDIMGDVDDVGAVAVLHALADAGEAEILAMGVSSTHDWSPPCLSALNSYFGRPDIPIGVLKGAGWEKESRYVRQVAEEFPRRLESAAAAPDATELYRRVLAAQPDGSVVFVSVGMLTNLRNLLASPPDQLAPMTGRELVKRKVKLWVCMGGTFPQGREYNLFKDAAASAYAVSNWPGRAVFSGYEIGDRIRTGAGTAGLPTNSPVRRAYTLYNGLKNRQSWDQTAVLYAVRGSGGSADALWAVQAGGTLEINPQDGSNRWNAAADGGHAYLVEKESPEKITRIIEDLMLQQPVAKPLPWVEGSSTLVVLPDTEVYSQKRPELFEAQGKWIAAQAKDRNIAYVLHVGDIVHDDVEAQWAVARRSLGLLDGVVPYALVPGNHDYAGGPRQTTMGDYFRADDFAKWPTYGGVMVTGRMENSFHLFRMAGRDWIILALEFGPRDETVAWANKILDEHPRHLAILMTHAYLFRNNKRFDHTAGLKERASPHGAGNDGEELWQKLVRRHANMRLVLSGHVATGGLGYLASEGDHGNTVHQLMADYENMRGGGSGYLRLLEFLPDGETVQVKAYSPALNRHLTDPGNQYTFTLKLAEPGR